MLLILRRAIYPNKKREITESAKKAAVILALILNLPTFSTSSELSLFNILTIHAENPEGV